MAHSQVSRVYESPVAAVTHEHKPRGLKQQTGIFSQRWTPEVQNQCQQGHTRPGVSGRRSSLASPSFRWPQAVPGLWLPHSSICLVFRHLVHTWLHLSCQSPTTLCLCLTRTFVTGLSAHQGIRDDLISRSLVSLPLQRACLQFSQVRGLQRACLGDPHSSHCHMLPGREIKS